MIQFNLLPDIKKEYIKAKRTKRLIVTMSVLVSVGAIILTGLLYSYVQIGQKGDIDNLATDINNEISEIRSIEDFDKILTIQNQLNTINGLHEMNPETSRLFNYLFQLTPTSVKIQELSLTFDEFRLNISGSADSLADINTYVDTFKFAKYKYEVEGVETEGDPFTQVFSELTRNSDNASYSITMVFDPIIFDNTKDVQLIVDKQFTTRSITEKPSLSEGGNSLFEDSSGEE